MKYNMNHSMSQAFMKNPSQRASLRASRTARTVLLRMAADDARAQRIRDLREKTGAKWREIAAYCGVTDRSAQQWGATGSISDRNAVKLTEFFRGRGAYISDDYIMRGDRPATPPLLNVLEGAGEGLTATDELLGRLAALEEQVRLLRAELAAADAEALKRNDAVLHAIRESR